MDRTTDSTMPKWLRFLFFLFFLYLFFVAIGLMGDSFKLLGEGIAKGMIEATRNPFTGLMIGILATSIVQSSSFTTSTVVAIIATSLEGPAGQDPELVYAAIHGAVPIIMGANIGTSVTNLIVSMGHIGQAHEFERAFAGATMHDFFNWIAVLMFLPLEIAFGFLTRIGIFMSELFLGADNIKFTSPLKILYKPVTSAVLDFLENTLGLHSHATATVCIILAFVLLFVALIAIVKNMRALMLDRLEVAIDKLFGANPIFAIIVGMVITAIIQSSSITTSLLVPLIGAGAMSLEAAFPITLGANIGTTVTAMLAALAKPAGLPIAFVHFSFNLLGTIIIYAVPGFKQVPMKMARWLAAIAVRKKVVALGFIVGIFYVIPLAIFGISQFFH